MLQFFFAFKIIKIIEGVIFRTKRPYSYSRIRSIERTLNDHGKKRPDTNAANLAM